MERDFGFYVKHSLYLAAASLLLLASIILMFLCGLGAYYDVLYSVIPMTDKKLRFLNLPEVFAWAFSLNTSITEIVGTVVIFDLKALLSGQKIIRFGRAALIFLKWWGVFWFAYDILTNIVGAWLATRQVIPTILLTITTTFADILFIGALALFISSIAYLRDVWSDFKKAIGPSSTNPNEQKYPKEFEVIK